MKAILAVILFAPALALAATYKCQDASGRYTYADRPCAENQTAVGAPKREAEPTAPKAPVAPPYRRPAPVTVAPLPKTDLSALPKDEQGRPVLTQVGGARVVLDPKAKRGPVNFIAACSVMITRCYKPGERELDACFMSPGFTSATT